MPLQYRQKGVFFFNIKSKVSFTFLKRRRSTSNSSSLIQSIEEMKPFYVLPELNRVHP
jgi:hypothetical protein